MGEWGEFYYGRSCPKWSVTEDAITPCVRYGELYTKFGSKIDEIYSYTNMPVDNLRFSKGNEVLIPRVGEDPMDYNHCTWLSIPGVAIGEMISVFNTTQSPLFSAIMFNATLQREFAMRVEGGSVTNLYYDKLKNIDVLYPTMEEQKEIARYFSTLDHLITLHQRKCDETKKLKKFMLQKMFPKNGEKNPEIRFAGFTDDWEQRKLGEIIDAYNEKKPKNIDLPVLTSSRQGIQKQEEHFGSEQKHDTKDYNVIPMGYCTYRNRSDDKTFTFNINHSVKRGIVSKFYPVFSIINGNAKFITEFLNNNLEIKNKLAVLAVGTSQVVLSFANLKELEICVPSKLEQDKIGNYIETLDHLITLHQRK